MRRVDALDPVLTVLIFSSVAALAGGLGALPFVGGRFPSSTWLGGAYSISGGAMLGAGYVLAVRGLERGDVTTIIGGLLGVACTRWLRSYAHVEDLASDPAEERPAVDTAGRYVLRGSLHAALEGVAIGAAMAHDLSLGVFLALAFALHNVGESMALTDVLCRRGARWTACAGLGIATNVAQPLLAVFAFALAPALGNGFPVLVGFGAGSLVFLVLSEVTPASYERADSRLVAILLSGSAAALILIDAVMTGGGE